MRMFLNSVVYTMSFIMSYVTFINRPYVGSCSSHILYIVIIMVAIHFTGAQSMLDTVVLHGVVGFCTWMIYCC